MFLGNAVPLILGKKLHLRALAFSHCGLQVVKTWMTVLWQGELTETMLYIAAWKWQ